MGSTIKKPSIRLPSGVRDFLPRATARRRAIAESLLSQFELWGYQRVITPLYECNDVLERGLGEDARAEILRFVEPRSGEIVALRPDITPQIARVAATRLADVDGPVRLCYQGSVTRVHGNIAQPRQILQAGVELIHAESPLGDAELLAVATAALAKTGVEHIRIDVGHVALTRHALARVGDVHQRHEIHNFLNKKDASGVDRAGKSLPKGLRTILRELPQLYGCPTDVLERAKKLPLEQQDIKALLELEHVLRYAYELIDPELRSSIGMDLGNVRGFEYYTGVRFSGFLDGYGSAVLRGGRYDQLIGHYGREAHASGFAVDIEAIAQAHRQRGNDIAVDLRVLVVAEEEQRSVGVRLAAILRKNGVRAAFDLGAKKSRSAIGAYARSVGFSTVAMVGPSSSIILRIPSAEGAKPVMIDKMATKVICEALTSNIRPLIRALVVQKKGS